ncbi:hypothetical protein PVAP13_4KG377902, partial [Panicum virgatum]
MIDQRCILLDWNVRGLNNAARRKVVRDLVQDNCSTIVCLQETKMQTIDRAVVCESLGQRFADQFVFLPALGTRGGALLAVDETYYKILQSDVRVNSVSAKLQPTTGEDHAKLQFLQELRDIRNYIPEKWLAIGDFNMILQAQDKSNTNL